MKTKVLTSIGVALMLLMSMNVMAQTFIPKAGLSMATVSISDDIKEAYNSPDISFKAGFVGGLAVDFEITELISIQPELLYHQKGYSLKASEDGFSLDETLTLNYLELPVMVKFKFGNFYANAGPTFAYGIGGKWKQTYSFQGDSETYDGKVKFAEEPDNPDEDTWYVDVPFEVGLGIGAGYKLLDKILIDVRYGMGLTSIYTNEDNFDWTTKNSSIQLTVAYPIPMSK